MIMKCKFFCPLFLMLLLVTGMHAQLGIRAGINMANEINTFSQSELKAGFNSTNLTGYQIGLVYQVMPKNTGFGIESGVLYSQKGSSFSDSTNIANVIKQGYKELNYLEIPVNIRYRLSLGGVALYGFGGVYVGYALNGKTVDETTNDIQDETFSGFSDHTDYGYNIGGGVELFKKIQFGATWSQGLKNTSASFGGLPTPTKATNRVYSINLVYLF